jgi:monofunctional biosynthetic peptidoglycan transglycosylase
MDRGFFAEHCYRMSQHFTSFKKLVLGSMKLGKLFFWALFVLTLSVVTLTLAVFWGLPDVSPLKSRVNTLTISVPDWQGGVHPFPVGPANPYWTPLELFPDELKWAVIVAEDANFYEHGGFDITALKEALKYDLKHKRMQYGASTITQQLAKNLFLSRDKSVLRKLRELVLATRMEQELTKGRILELYLNVVELGPLVYGFGHAAEYHFGIPVEYLTPAEAAFLVATLPGPRVAFNPRNKLAKVRRRTARLIKLLSLRNILDETEVNDALVQIGQLDGRQTVRDDKAKAPGLSED